MTTFRVFDWNRAKSDFATLFTDFFSLVSGDWTTTVAGTGTATVGNEAGGILNMVNSGTDNHAISMQWAGGTGATKETFKFTAGKKLLFTVRASINDVVASDFFAGLIITDTDFEGGVTDGIYFRKLNGSSDLYLVVEKDSAETAVKLAVTLVNNTFVTLEFYYDGTDDKIKAFADGKPVGAAAITTAPNDEELALSVAIQNGAGAIKSAKIDFIGASQQR